MSTGTKKPGQISARSVILGLLAVLALGVLMIGVAPRVVTLPSSPLASEPHEDAVPAPVEKEGDSGTGLPAPIDVSDPELLRARAAAQELRERFKRAVQRLEQSGVERWAQSRVRDTRSLAEEAETAFGERKFALARDRYRQAVDMADALVAEIPDRLQSAIDAGLSAIENGDKESAGEQFSLALALDPGNEQATQGLARVEVMDQVQEKLTTARRLMQIDELGNARRALQEALQLDAKSRQAATLMAQIDGTLGDREFSQVMGQTLRAIDAGRFGEASRHLARARQLRPSDPAVLDATSRIAEAGKETRLASLRQEAQAQVEEENWAGAVATYESAKKIDPTVAFAHEGLDQARGRAALDQQLEDYVRRPSRLQSAAVREQASQALVSAIRIDPRGPRLETQIERLREALKEATTPVEVTLKSDRSTKVTIYRVGDQGRFDQKTLTLQPGRYTVIGSRNGYRDVRHEIEVKPGMAPVDIRATEPL